MIPTKSFLIFIDYLISHRAILTMGLSFSSGLVINVFAYSSCTTSGLVYYWIYLHVTSHMSLSPKLEITVQGL